MTRSYFNRRLMFLGFSRYFELDTDPNNLGDVPSYDYAWSVCYTPRYISLLYKRNKIRAKIARQKQSSVSEEPRVCAYATVPELPR